MPGRKAGLFYECMLKLPAKYTALPGVLPGEWPFLTRNPGKTSGAAWCFAWRMAIFDPKSRQNPRRCLVFCLVFYQNAIIAAVCQAIAGLVACILSSNCENSREFDQTRTIKIPYCFSQLNGTLIS
jgi:hypothetical protein